MRKIYLTFILVCLALKMCAQDNVICVFENNGIVTNSSFIDNTFVDVSNSTAVNTNGYTSTYYNDASARTVKIEVDTAEEEYGFYEIRISRSDSTLLHVKQDDSWTYTFNGKSTLDYSPYTSNRYFIPLLSDANLDLIAFVGWPYGGELPLLTIIALTGNEARIVYNRHAVISSIIRTPLFEMTLETVLLEYTGDAIPVNEQVYHKIKYQNHKLIYD